MKWQIGKNPIGAAKIRHEKAFVNSLVIFN